MIVRGKPGRATGAPYKPNLTEPDTHYMYIYAHVTPMK
jgi:hypothetical protein